MSNIKLSPEYKEAFAKVSADANFKKVLEWLKIQKNNIAVLEWKRLFANDPQLAIKKARYEGNIETIDLFLEAIKVSLKNKEDE